MSSEPTGYAPAPVVRPIVREVEVPVDQSAAFEAFTARIGDWWPLASHSVYGEEATVCFEGGRVVERAQGRDDAVWGEVLDWDPPRRFRITWHPGTDPDSSTEVTVEFLVADEHVRVRLTHSGWERRPEARPSYAEGWVRVLDRFARCAPAG